jgi:hypothetical protein
MNKAVSLPPRRSAAKKLIEKNLVAAEIEQAVALFATEQPA